MVSSLSAAMSEAEAAAAMQSLLQQLAPSISNGDKISGLPGSWSAELAADASSGVLAGIIDGLAVRIPEAMTAGAAGSAADTVAGPGGSGGGGGGGQGGGHRQSGSNLPHLQLLPRLATDTPQVLRTAMFWRSSTAAAQENDASMVTLDSRLGVRIFATDAGCAASLLKPPVCVTWGERVRSVAGRCRRRTAQGLSPSRCNSSAAPLAATPGGATSRSSTVRPHDAAGTLASVLHC